jgi:hypothetical protein
VRRIFSLVGLCAVAAAMSLAAGPRHAAAISEVDLRFEVTVKGQPPSEKQLQLFVSPSPLNPQAPSPQTLFVFCGGQGTCQDGTTYHWEFPHVPLGTVLTYRFQVVTFPTFSTVVIASGKFTATKDQTIRAAFTYNAGTIPNTAVAPKVEAGQSSPLLLLGILMLLATTMLAWLSGWRLSGAVSQL